MSQAHQRPQASSTLLTVAAFVVVVAGLRAAEPIVVSFLLSVFLAIISAPPLLWLENRGLPKWLAMLTVIMAIAAVALGITALLGNSINDFSRDIPFYKTRLKEQFGGLISWLNSHGVELTRDQVMSYVNPGKAIQLVGDIFDGFGGVLTNALLIFLTVILILFEAHSFPRKVRAAIDDPENKLERFDKFAQSLIRYLAIKTLTSLGTGIAIGFWLAIMGVQYPVLWGLLAFLFNYVPNIGSIIAAVPALLLTVIQFGPISALWVALGYLVVNVLFGNVIEPRFMGRGLGLSTLVVFLSLVFWGWVLGPVGMLLSVPLTMSLKIALDGSRETRWLAIMLGPESRADGAKDAAS